MVGQRALRPRGGEIGERSGVGVAGDVGLANNGRTCGGVRVAQEAAESGSQHTWDDVRVGGFTGGLEEVQARVGAVDEWAGEIFVDVPSDSEDEQEETPREQTIPGDLSAAESAEVERAVVVACQLASVLSRKRHRHGAFNLPRVTSVRAMLRAALQAAAVTYGTRAAEDWAEGFIFTPVMRGQDASLLARCGGDFVEFYAQRRARGAPNRLSVRRVRALVCATTLSDPADFDRLLRIAEGLHITTPEDFRPSGFENRPPLRRKYREEVSHAVNKLLSIQWGKGTVILLPTEIAARIPGIHFSPQHWALKAGKAQGRSICDTSNPAPGSAALNGTGKEGKDLMREVMTAEWGRIVHPTLQDLVTMVLEMVDRYGAEKLVLWKMDLASAFNLMDFDAASATLLAFELTEGMTVIHNTGMFGWTGTPYAFQVITRVILDLCRQHLEGLVRMYVDDLLGVAHVDARESDMRTADGLARGLLGPTAVAADKTEWGRALDWLGWHIDLDLMTVSASARNMQKAVHAFFFADLADDCLSLAQTERMASYASRYSVLCPQMVPYVAALHAFKAGFGGDHNARRTPSTLVRSDVVMWRAFFCLLELDPANFARSLYSFRPRGATVRIEYDASLTGLGAIVSRWEEETQQFVQLRYTAMSLPFLAPANDSSRQNTNEYLAVIMGLLLIRQEGLASSGFVYTVVGDNVSSLSWCRKGKAKSILARAANVGLSLLTVDMDATLGEALHIPGEDNVQCDGLSRGLSGPEVGLPADRFCALRDDVGREFLRLCDPAREIVTDLQHIERARGFIDVLGGDDEPSL